MHLTFEVTKKIFLKIQPLREVMVRNNDLRLVKSTKYMEYLPITQVAIAANSYIPEPIKKKKTGTIKNILNAY